MRNGLRDGSGRHPLFAAALVTVAGVAAADMGLPWGLLAVSLCVATGLICGGWRQALTWFVCGGLAVGVFTWRESSRERAETELLASRGGLTTARMLEDGRGNERFWHAPAKITAGPHAGAKVWWLGRGEVPVAGARVRAKGGFQPLQRPRNPGEFDRAAWLRRQGVAAEFRSMGTDDEVATGKPAALGAWIRHGFRERLVAGLPEDSQEAHVIRAMVIGERPPDEERLIAAFLNSGTLHVFSVSGLHVAMVAGFGWLLLGWAGVPRRQAVPLLIALAFGYAWITGNSPPAVRSAWMLAVFLGAFVFRRRPDLLNSLGAVLLAAMLWDGRLLFQAGVQLSYGVVAAIALGSAWAARTFSWMTQPELYLPFRQMTRWQQHLLKMRRNIAGSLAVSLAAGVGSAPLTAFHFGLVTPVSVIASLVLVPLVFVLLGCALVSAALYSISPPLARALNQLNGLVANTCVLAAEGFSAIPGSHFVLRADNRPALLVYDLEYGAGAACFSDGNNSAVLIDCGSRQSFDYVVAPSLRKLAITPDSVVISHPDGGHLGGGPLVWERFPIRQVLLPVERARSPTFRAWIEKAPPAGIRLLHTSSLRLLPLPDGARLEVLHAPDAQAHNALADDRVAVYRLHWRGWKILFTSDAGMGTELRMLDNPTDVAADVIIAGRHRSDLSLCDRFLDAVNPLAIIASNSPYPEGEAILPATIAYWKSRGIRVIDQRESGGVTLRVNEDGKLHIEGFLTDTPVILSPR
ncbi:MAG: ComEC/Rec2 family competence protein [Akkermansiaceae bacterium]|jgi:ComEC/Rec2-related protein|nr:ComEC/Rec2 family competence protein [Akkermansiaceae bacterium]